MPAIILNIAWSVKAVKKFGGGKIGFDWVRFGFVFTKCPIGIIFINHCMKRLYVHLQSAYGGQDWLCFA